MTQLMIRKIVPTTYQDIDSYSNHSYDYSMSNQIKSITPKIYRLRPHQQTSSVASRLSNDNEISSNRKNDNTLTPTKFRPQKVLASSNGDETNTIIMGDFMLTKNPNQDRSVYSYKPKHTQVAYKYKGILDSSEVQERAANTIKSLVRERNQFLSPDSIHKSISEKEFRPSSILLRSLTGDNLNRFVGKTNSVSTDDSESDSSEPNNRYYFGEETDYSATNGDDDEVCLVFGHDVLPSNRVQNSTIVQQKTQPTQRPTYRTYINYVNDQTTDIILQQVVDVGTSIDSTLLDEKPSDNRTALFQKSSFDNRESIFTNQSSRSESETYRVSQQTKRQNNDEEIVLTRSPKVRSPTYVSKTDSSVIHSYINVAMPSNSAIDMIKNAEQSSTKSSQIMYTASSSHRSTSKPSLGRETLLERSQTVDSQLVQYENLNTNLDYDTNLSQKSVKSHENRRGFLGAKLPTFPTEKPIPRRPSSTPPTDLDDEFIEPRPNFGPGKRFPNTPRPKRDRRDDDSDSIIGNRSPNRQPKIDTQKSKLIDESTQSEEKLTRNVGTMHEPVQTRNFGNEVQPQSSSTQTTFLPAKKTPKTDYSFIERPEPRPIKYDDDDDYYPDRRSSPIPRQPTPRVIYDDPYDIILHQYIKCRTPSNSPPRRETIDYVYDGHYPACYETPYDDYTVLPEDTRHSHRPRSRPPPSAYSPCTIVTHRSRTSSPPPQHRHIVTPSPSHPVRCPSSPRRPRSATPRRRVQMHSQETDTSLDAMKRKHHTGVQYEPLSTREKGTTPSLRMRKPPTNHRSTTLDASIYSQHRYPIPHSTIPLDFNRSRRTHFHQPPTTTYDYREHRNQSSCNDYDDSGEEEEEEDEIRSMHDQSTMAELLVYLDHYTQCESQPFMADRYIQTTPTVDDNDNEHGNTFENGEESFIRQLPRSGSISIPQPIIIQPDTLPRRRQPQPQPSPTRPKRDGLDYTGNILEVSLHQGQLQRTASIRDSPLLNIGTENILNQPVAHEYATPFETRFIYESDSLSTLGSRKNGSMIAPVLNSARTHMFTQSPVRQSRSNGNFYLSTAPSRSSNSSIRVDITAEKS
ncbi:unnamed protein product [Rotaria socialis]|nr:unnamed protein product [Rotaria socialis]CAF4234889.1 unnamed protein product [Rotaria socialis]CAF4252824.1 unnamed protein product [Rotaria socialis]CAF4628204.1 unnamed protein product [Rotaria socialis]